MPRDFSPKGFDVLGTCGAELEWFESTSSLEPRREVGASIDMKVSINGGIPQMVGVFHGKSHLEMG